MTNLARFFSITGVLTLTLAAGCASPNDEATATAEETAEVEQAAVACPIGGSAVQAKVTKAYKYIIGGTVNPATGSLGLALTSLRSKVLAGRIDIFTPVAATVCYRDVGKAKLVAWGMTSVEINQLKALGDLADDAWGTGASRFIYVSEPSIVEDPTDPGKYFFTAWIDPEPAKLTQNLSGSTGATAAALYTGSNTATNVVKWVSTAAAGTVAGGTPCTTGDATIDTVTLRSIQVLSNGYRRCL